MAPQSAGVGARQQLTLPAVDTFKNDYATLREAARTGNEDVCRLVLQYGAKPNVVDFVSKIVLFCQQLVVEDSRSPEFV